VPDVYPTGGVGSTFGDVRITGAAKVAAAIEPHRAILKLQSIRLDETSRTAPVPQYEFSTSDGRGFFWGSPPGEEMYGEPKSEIKIRQLIERIASEAGKAPSERIGLK